MQAMWYMIRCCTTLSQALSGLSGLTKSSIGDPGSSVSQSLLQTGSVDSGFPHPATSAFTLYGRGL